MTEKRTIIVTGGTVNLGYYAALEIARQRPNDTIIIASRTDKDEAATSINAATGKTNTSFKKLDLADLSSVRSFVKDLQSQGIPPIDTVLFNAGLQFRAVLGNTVDGFEKTFAINHLGHALLFHLLLPNLTPDARIVVTSSGTHDPAQKSGMPLPAYTTAEAVAHPTVSAEEYPGTQRYTTSKLCNVLWTYALARRLQAAGKHISVVAFDPGLMPGSGLARDANFVLQFLWTRVLTGMRPLLRLVISPNIHKPQDSGANLAWLALDPEQRKQTAKYFEGRKEIKSSIDSYDKAKQDDLWNWTTKTLRYEDDL